VNSTSTNRPARFGRSHVVLASVLTLFGQSASAATYYVATNGNDSNPGTSAAPFQTLQKAANTAVAGDTVIVQNGTYGHVNSVTGGDNSGTSASPVVLYNSGNSSAPITFKAANKWGAVLDCEMICDAYIDLYNASYIVIQDFVITRGYKEGIHSNDAAHHITLRGNRIEYIANRSTSTTLGLDGMYTNPNCHDFIIDRNMFHDIGRTDVNWLDHALYLHGSNYTITNNIFHNIPHGWSIQAADGLSNVLIANNTFAFPSGGGQDGHIMLWNTQNGLTVRNNIFYNPRNYAITRYTSSLSSCAIDHNLVYGASGMMSDSSGCALGTNQTGSNPLFVNASTAPYDFHAQSGGAGIDAGLNISAVTVDFDGVSRPQGSSTDEGACEFQAPVTPPPVIAGVFTSGLSPNSAIINWSTDQPATSYAQYGLGSYTNTTPTDSLLVTTHSLVLSNLTASTVYHFRVGSTNSAGGATLSSDYTFTTPAPPVTAPPVTAPTNSGPADITSGLAAAWKLTEGSGSSAYDSSGNANTATLYNPTWWTSDYGTTVWFNGSNSYASIQESPSFEMTNQLTISLWLRPSVNSNTDPRVISKLYDWELKLNGSNRYPQFSAAGQYALLNYPLPLITWHHIVFTFSTGVVKGYVDGVQTPFLTNTFTGAETLAQWKYGLYLATDSSQTNSYIGSLDDVRVYNRALSAADVAALYAALQPVSK
jgi:Concanavalin A-like lectin/glucanases superfamily/Right handed beta helix region